MIKFGNTIESHIIFHQGYFSKKQPIEIQILVNVVFLETSIKYKNSEIEDYKDVVQYKIKRWKNEIK